MFKGLKISQLIKKAEAGDVKSQLEVADLYRFGKGVEPNLSEALRYYERAARQDSAEAIFFIAECYETGKGYHQDLFQALKHYLRAGKLGHAEAMTAAGHCYEVGRGASKDLTKAQELYEIAAKLGSGQAKANLERLWKKLFEHANLDPHESPLQRAKSRS